MFFGINISKLIDYLLLNAYSVNSSGLYNGKAGVSLCLYEIARFLQDEHIEYKSLIYQINDSSFQYASDWLRDYTMTNYDNIYSSAESGGGVSNWYIEGALSYARIGYNNYNGVGLSSITPNGRQIVAINNGTHAVIYEGYNGTNANGNRTVNYYDPQTGVRDTYTIGANEEFGMIGF